METKVWNDECGLDECCPCLIDGQSAVKITGVLNLSDPDGFQDPSLPIACSNSKISAVSQFGLWSLSHACTAIPFLLSLVFTAYLCSIILFRRVLPVSPIIASFTISAWYPVHNSLLFSLLVVWSSLWSTLALVCHLIWILFWYSACIFSETPWISNFRFQFYIYHLRAYSSFVHVFIS